MPVSIEIAACHPKLGTFELPFPARKTVWAAGYDLCAAIDEPIEMTSGHVYKIPLGFALGMPEGWEAQIRPRSGLSLKGVTMPNSPGTIDADYRGEVHAVLYLLPNPDGETFTIHPGDRIAQMVIAPVPSVIFVQRRLTQLKPTIRGTAGFGSTGISLNDHGTDMLRIFLDARLPHRSQLKSFMLLPNNRVQYEFLDSESVFNQEVVELPEGAREVLEKCRLSG